MHPSTPNGRVARARGGKCARIGLERAFVLRADNYSGMILNRGSAPRGTLRNTHSHRAWERMRRIVVDCGQIVPWIVPEAGISCNSSGLLPVGQVHPLPYPFAFCGRFHTGGGARMGVGVCG
jgi:hypothetical protein